MVLPLQLRSYEHPITIVELSPVTWDLTPADNSIF